VWHWLDREEEGASGKEIRERERVRKSEEERERVRKSEREGKSSPPFADK
jgi:hypothetical protein